LLKEQLSGSGEYSEVKKEKERTSRKKEEEEEKKSCVGLGLALQHC
jgi:hypothetical protein